jgi:hypothetical protein
MKPNALVAFATVQFLAIARASADDANDKINAYLEGRAFDASSIPPESRPVVVQRIHEILNGPNVSADTRYTYNYKLAQLGDADGFRGLLETFHGRGGDIGGIGVEGQLGDFANETLLPLIIPDVFDPSTEWVSNGTDVSRAPISYRAAKIALQCLMNSDKFSARTRQWAHEMVSPMRSEPNYSRNRARDLMRQWWEHNKAAVLAKQYDKATWLPPSDAPYNPSPTDGSETTGATPSTTDGNPESSASAPVASIPTHRSSASEWRAYAAITAVLLAIAAALIFVLNRKRQGRKT